MSIRTLLARRPGILTPAFNDFFEPWNEWFKDGVPGKSMTLPNVNISEDKNGYSLDVAAPGLHKKDFKIEVNGNVLTISAEKEQNKEEKEENYTRQEYNYSSFSRAFTLPEDVVQDKIDATYDGGILKLSLPKNEKAIAGNNHKVISIN
jgi:HSP20 family protein